MLFLRVIRGGVEPEITFLVHAFVSIITLAIVGYAFMKKKDLSYPLLLFLSVYGAGVFGLGGFIILLLTRPLYQRIFSSAEEWFKELFPERLQDSFHVISERIDAGWNAYDKQTEVFSFQDLFTCGTLAQKQAVLEAIIKDFNPVYSSLLKDALKDPHNAIRIQAAAIIEKIDVEMGKKKQRLKKKWQNKKDSDSLLALARHCEMYGTLGLLNEIEARSTMDEAISYYQKHLKENPRSSSSAISIGKLLLLEEKYEQLLEMVDEYKKTHAILPQILYTWELDALYRLQDHERLEKYIEQNDS